MSAFRVWWFMNHCVISWLISKSVLTSGMLPSAVKIHAATCDVHRYFETQGRTALTRSSASCSSKAESSRMNTTPRPRFGQGSIVSTATVAMKSASLSFPVARRSLQLMTPIEMDVQTVADVDHAVEARFAVDGRAVEAERPTRVLEAPEPRLARPGKKGKTLSRANADKVVI